MIFAGVLRDDLPQRYFCYGHNDIIFLNVIQEETFS